MNVYCLVCQLAMLHHQSWFLKVWVRKFATAGGPAGAQSRESSGNPEANHQICRSSLYFPALHSLFPTPPSRVFLPTSPHWLPRWTPLGHKLRGRGRGLLHHRAIDCMAETADTLSSVHLARLISSTKASNWKNQSTASVISNYSFCTGVEFRAWAMANHKHMTHRTHIFPCPVASWTHWSPVNPIHVANIKSRC